MELYVHVPFCRRKCHYCDFCSVSYDNGLAERYFDALLKEIALTDTDEVIDTVYIGGGTPSVVDADKIAKVLLALNRKFDYRPAEVSIECNPESLTTDKLDAYLQAGINRISIGVQSLNDTALKAVGRLHDSARAIAAVKLAKSRFENVSCDLILGLPYDSVTSVKESVDTLVGLGITHISCYGLKVEDNTKLSKMVNKGLILPTDDEQADIYDCIFDTTTKLGFLRYEVSNFARAGYECRHNLGYWRRENYIGFGAAAHSLCDAARYNNYYDIERYINALSKGVLPRENFANLSADDEEFETIMLALRLSGGLDVVTFNERYGVDFAVKYSAAIEKCKRFCTLTPARYFINSDYFYIMNDIICEFL